MRKDEYYLDRQMYVQTLLNRSMCKVCGKRGTLFHHRNPQEKSFNVGRSFECSLIKLRREIAKCDILCRSCHQKIHLPGYQRKFVYPSVSRWQNYWRVRFWRDKKFCRCFKTKKEAIVFANEYALERI